MLISTATNSLHPAPAVPLRQPSNFSSYLLSIPLKCSYKLPYLSTLYYHCYSQRVALLPISPKKSGYQLSDLTSSAFSSCLKTQLCLCIVFFLSQWKRCPTPIYALDPLSTCCLSKTSLHQYILFLSISSFPQHKKMLKSLLKLYSYSSCPSTYHYLSSSQSSPLKIILYLLSPHPHYPFLPQPTTIWLLSPPQH